MTADSDSVPPLKAWFVNWHMEDNEPPFGGQHGRFDTLEAAEEKAADMRRRGEEAGRAVRVEIVEGERVWVDEFGGYYGYKR